MKHTKKKKVLLIGWDGADWKVINPLLDAGKMPNLERFINGGVMGNLATLYPSLSPMLWTSIATGKRPFKHGILGFTEPNPQGQGIRPISNFSRKTRAIWNILNLNGMKSNIVGWWPSHPAEPINGVMVSDHYHQVQALIDKPWPLQPGTVYPEHLKKKLAELRVHPQEVASDAIGTFVPDFGKVDQEKDHRLESLAKIISECASIQAAATALIQLEPWDFMAVYYNSIDHFCHGFMRYHPPRMEDVSEEEFKLYSSVVEGGYRFHDMMFGVLMALAGEDTTVILISDHGFHPDHLRMRHIPVEPAGPAAQHREHGIFIMKGPGIKRDEIMHGASLLDTTPTILHLYGLSVGEDMDGFPLVNAFEQYSKVDTIPSWDSVPGKDGSHPEDIVVDPVESREAINQLVALGYIEKPDDNMEKAAADTVRELDYNLARSYMDANRHLDAIPVLEKLTEEWPDEYRFGIHLIMCCHALERNADARRVMNNIFENKGETSVRAIEELKKWNEKHKDTKPEELSEKERYELRRLQSKAGRNPFGMECLIASQFLAEGDAEKALHHLDRAEKFNPAASQLHIKKGDAYLKLKKWNNAEESFQRALDIDPENSASHIGLCRSFLGCRRSAMAADEALAAIGLAFFNPKAHFLLGVALHRMRRPLQAIEALKVAVLQNPNHKPALDRLAYIYEKWLKDTEKAEDYRKQASEAKCRMHDLKTGKIKPHETEQPGKTALTSDIDILEFERDKQEKPTVPLSETIVIVSGLPRSGTSMTMQMLAAGGISPLMDDNRPADSHNEKGYYEDSRVRALHCDASWITEAKGRVVKVIAQLLSRLPKGREYNYRVIFMVRDLTEVVASQRDMLADQGKRGAEIPDAVLQNTYVSQLRQIRRFLAVRKIPVLYIRYRDCIKNPDAGAVRINTFLDGRLNVKNMAESVDVKLYRHKDRKRKDVLKPDGVIKNPTEHLYG